MFSTGLAKWRHAVHPVGSHSERPLPTSTTQPGRIGPADLNAVVADDMAAVDRMIRSRLHSEVALVGQLGHYIIGSGGKRLRPMVALLSARAHGYGGPYHVNLAAIIEFIHTATLLHDDVVDGSYMRRGKQTANLVWGNEASVLVGDFLYSRAFQMMVEIRDMRVMEILADATNTIAEGEVMQLVNCHDPDTTEERYLDIIRSKTAKLFEAAARLGAIVSEREAETGEAMGEFGSHLGTAFQLIDDVLDYSASSQELGKNVGDDLAEGKPTLPLLYAMWNGSPGQACIIRQAIEEGGREHLPTVLNTIESTGAIAYTARLAEQEARRALDALAVLEPSRYRDALQALAGFAVHRRA
ncbi:MAG: octaprenyl diphosphate synthase [Gammaproteobacteria bacterium]|nr:octaprenyl diphosphate synthase [Gammaproteobacteria bacterium]